MVKAIVTISIFTLSICGIYSYGPLSALITMVVFLIAAACAYLEKGYRTYRWRKERPPQCVIIIALLFSLSDFGTAIQFLLSVLGGVPYGIYIEPACIMAAIIELVFSIIALIFCIIALAIYKREEDYPY